jgi:hypothetical protein
MNDRPPDTDRRAVRRTAIVLAIALLLVASAVAYGTVRGRDTHAGSPVGTVRSFLIVTAIDHNGVVGCRYLTVEESHRLQVAQPAHPSCAIALTARRLTLGGRTLDDEAAVKRLTYRSRQSGDRATVTVSGNGGSITFGLRRATASERAEFQPPATDWRIDSGVDGLAGW